MLCFCRDGNRALQRGLTTDADGLVPGTLNFAWTLGGYCREMVARSPVRVEHLVDRRHRRSEFRFVEAGFG